MDLCCPQLSMTIPFNTTALLLCRTTMLVRGVYWRLSYAMSHYVVTQNDYGCPTLLFTTTDLDFCTFNILLTNHT